MPESPGGSKERDSSHSGPAPELLVEDGIELRIALEENAEELFLLIEANREYLREWLPWLDDVNSVNDEISAIRRGLNTEEGWMYLIFLDGNIVGTLGLNSIDWANRRVTIGYWLAEELMGKGIISKSCSRLLDHCFKDLGLHRAGLLAAVENQGSRAVAERLGMRLEGIFKDREWLYDHYVDAAVYGITAPEWEASNQG
ncbi:MAG: GNAT family protein [Candidatus Thalassarchaeaceae archaeon]|jgi:ribosomal-protein-serine acetyltransferase|nr:GNAT family protein [Candidatus Thalassarchaeaceae archaeon]